MSWVTHQGMEAGVAIKRLFVDPAGPATAWAHALLTAIFAQMAQDDDTTIRISSAKRLTHARAIYESVWFQDIPSPRSCPNCLLYTSRCV